MELYLQFGWGMMSLSHELCREWGQGTVILSPRDLKPERLVSFGNELREGGVETLVDPQFFLPRADHKRLTSYDYWPENFDTHEFGHAEIDQMVSRLVSLNDRIDAQHFIIPGCRAITVDDDWSDMQMRFRLSAQELAHRDLMATICLSSESLRDEEQVGRVMDLEESSTVGSYYLVLENPAIAYIADDPQWLANSLDLVAGLKRLGSEVVVGYSNQQQLILATAAVNAIASGTWMNVRSFPPGKFMEEEGDIKQKAVWFYLPQALSEFKIQFLDIATRLGLSEIIIPDPMSHYAIALINAPQPSTSGWGEGDAFRHYLHALREQSQLSTRDTFEATIAYQRKILDRAEAIISDLHESGVSGQHRDFADAIHAHRAALIVLERTQGPVLSRDWSSLI